MNVTRFVGLIVAGVVAGVVCLGASGAAGQQTPEPAHEAGSVTPIYEGWFRNADGTRSLLLGYTNTNLKVPIDVPVGADNGIEPGGPDRGQPTHFNPQRQSGMFAIVVPADFGRKTLVWTVVANGQKQLVSMALDPAREIAPLKDAATGSTPPVVSFTPQGRTSQGPPTTPAATINAVANEPTALTVRAMGTAPLAVRWSRFRGPGIVRIKEPLPIAVGPDGSATITATFLSAGEYVMRAQVNQGSGESGNGVQCCWTGALLTVVVKAPAPAAAPSPTPSPTAKSTAPIDLTGYWVSIISEDWRYRMVTPARGDYASVPITLEGKRVADTWDPVKDEAAGEACKSYGAAGLMHVPGRLHITWQDDSTLKVETDAGTQTRLLHFVASDAARSAEPSWQGYSVASWEFNRAKPTTGNLKVVTTRMRPGYLRKNGVPYSGDAVLTEFWDLHKEKNGDQWIVITTDVNDPKYLQDPFLTSPNFQKEPDGSKWDPSPCSATW